MRDQLEALILQMYRSNILYSEAVREFKKKFILTVLQENKGNQCRAARELGMHRNTLSRTISELKIDVRQLRDGIKRPPRSARPATYEKKSSPAELKIYRYPCGSYQILTEILQIHPKNKGSPEGLPFCFR